MKLGATLFAAVSCLIASGAGIAAADEIKVSPGSGALAAGLAKAKAGDVVKVAAGEYPESVTIGEGVTVEGEGAATTIIIATDYAALNCKGPNVRIVGLTVRGGDGDKNVRGVNSSTPVRIERCRFEKVKEAVALMEAPLSDIIACEFDECGIGVRAIGGASPTVWGCVFKGGSIGVFGMDGSPYIRNNLFDSVKSGIRLAPNDTQPGIIRNNVFVGCDTTAIELMAGKSAFFGPSIRNSVFVRCGAALVAPADLAKQSSHAVLHEVKAPAMRDSAGKETVKVGEASLTDGAITITIEKDFTVKVEQAELLEGRGVRLSSEKEDAKGTIGLEKSWSRVGTGATAELPPQRFGGKMLIANSVHEEYQYLRVIRRRMERQSMGSEGGVSVDRLTLSGNGEPKELAFDISRFFSEASMK